jgi:hypothetical protein
MYKLIHNVLSDAFNTANIHESIYKSHKYQKQKSKFVPALLTEHHAMEAYWGVEV